MAGAAKEVVFDLDAAAFSSDDFRIYQFKVKRCPRARPHDWTQCPFAHPGEKAKRRDPRRYRYSGTACPEFRRNGCCRRGDACPFAHGVFECWLHPSRYRTQMCTDGSGCKRRVCFFAHTDSELRKPEEDPVWLQQQLQSELAQEHQVQQQIQAFKVFAGMLGGGPAAASPPPPPATSNNSPAAELLKSIPASSLASLLGLAAPQHQQQPALDDKLKSLVQQLAAGNTPGASANQANPQNLLQLLQLLESAKAQPPSPPPAPQPPLQGLAGLLAGASGLDQGSGSTDLSPLKLAQLLQSTGSSDLGRLAPAPSKAPPSATSSSLDLLTVLAQLQQGDEARTSAPAVSQPLTSMLQHLGLSQAMDSSSSSVLPAETLSVLAAALGAVSEPQRPAVPASQALDTPFGHPQNSLDANLAAFLQQAGGSEAPNAANSLMNLNSVLSQLSMAGASAEHHLVGSESLKAGVDQRSSMAGNNTADSNHILGSSGQESDSGLMTLLSQLSSKHHGDVMTNAKALMEILGKGDLSDLAKAGQDEAAVNTPASYSEQ